MDFEGFFLKGLHSLSFAEWIIGNQTGSILFLTSYINPHTCTPCSLVVKFRHIEQQKIAGCCSKSISFFVYVTQCCYSLFSFAFVSSRLLVDGCVRRLLRIYLFFTSYFGSFHLFLTGWTNEFFFNTFFREMFLFFLIFIFFDPFSAKSNNARTWKSTVCKPVCTSFVYTRTKS